MQSDELPGVLEARDKATPPLPSPSILEHVLLARDSPEDLQTKLLLCNDQSFPDDPAFPLVHPPYYRTSDGFTNPSSLAASHTSTETEESFSEGRVNTKQDEKVSYSAVSTGYFPYYRTYEELLGQPFTYGLNAEGKKPDNDGKDESEGNGETTTPPSLELDKRTPSTTGEEPPAHQLLRDSTSERRLSKISLPSGLLGLNQPFSSSGYFPYYRTEGELHIVPGLGDRFFTEKEGSENKEEGQGRETSIFSLSARCLVC